MASSSATALVMAVLVVTAGRVQLESTGSRGAAVWTPRQAADMERVHALLGGSGREQSSVLLFTSSSPQCRQCHAAGLAFAQVRCPASLLT
jgi:hypothetical protein